MKALSKIAAAFSAQQSASADAASAACRAASVLS